MTPNTIYVGRPSQWGNPFYTKWPRGQETKLMEPLTPTEAVREYKMLIEGDLGRILTIKRELKGKNLACWCPLDRPCHGDVLLEIANEK